MGELWRRVWYLLNRSRFERELREEMEAHRAMKGEIGTGDSATTCGCAKRPGTRGAGGGSTG